MKLEENLNEFIDEYKPTPLTKEDEEYDKYCKLYKEKFKKRAYIAEPNGTKKQTIEAIKICLEKNEDLLDNLLYPNYNNDTKNGNLY